MKKASSLPLPTIFPAKVSPEDIAILIYTSGTTGMITTTVVIVVAVNKI